MVLYSHALMSTRLRALALYKDLLRLAKDYPDPALALFSYLHFVITHIFFSYDYRGRIRFMFKSMPSCPSNSTNLLLS
jgi:hypothetical protein